MAAILEYIVATVENVFSKLTSTTAYKTVLQVQVFHEKFLI